MLEEHKEKKRRMMPKSAFKHEHRHETVNFVTFTLNEQKKRTNKNNDNSCSVILSSFYFDAKQNFI
jgi:hypothetical protein